MTLFTDITTRIHAIRDLVGEVTTPETLPTTVEQLNDADAVALLELASGLGQFAERLRTTAAGVVAQRSTRATGHAGLAQSRGHRNAVALVQQVAGVTRAEAFRQVRVGESLLEGPTALARHSLTLVGIDGTDGGTDGTGTDAAGTDAAGGVISELATDSVSIEAWNAPLARALLTGTITAAQHDAISRGLGEPPESDNPKTAAESAAAWSLAAEQLVSESGAMTVEDLAKSARSVRDVLDPVGAEERYLARFEARSFRMWTDREGLTRGSIVFDDFSAAWLRTAIDAAMRPRRGGPRFVDPSEQARAEALVADPRTNDQLVFDLFIDVMRAGTLADAETVFGTRQPGVRLVQIVPDSVDTDTAGTDATGKDSANPQGTDGANDANPGRESTGAPSGAPDSFAGTGYTEDDAQILPGWVTKQQACTSGTVTVMTDKAGNPLSLGRTSRLFTSKQRVALAVRDGGCRWTECDRPASYCEAHHIDPWREGGKTDTDRGILLCRFHHMQLHHRGWRITRNELDDFVLHDPGGKKTVLPRRLTHRYVWGDIDPPPKRFTMSDTALAA